MKDMVMLMGRMICNIYSYSLKREITLHILLPFLHAGSERTTHHVDAPYPVLYLLHGGANDCSTFERYTSVERYAEEANMIVVLFSAENKYYRTLEVAPVDQADGRITEDFIGLIHDELPEFLQAWLPVMTDCANTYIAGFSMGGYGAAFHVLLKPERFRAVGIFSGLVFQRPLVFYPQAELEAMTERERIDAMLPELLDLLHRDERLGKQLPDAFFSIGTKDITSFLPMFAKLWHSAGGNVRTDFYSKPYAHEWAFWDLTLRDFFKWLPRADSHAPRR